MRTFILGIGLTVAAFVGALIWAQGTDRVRFETKQWPIDLAAGSVVERFYVNVTKDRFNGATLYTLTQAIDGRVSIVGHSAIPGPREPEPAPTPAPTPSPSASPSSTPPPTPTATPTPWPPYCDPGYEASLHVALDVQPSLVLATFTAGWTPPPASGVLTDDSIPLRRATVLPGVPFSWVYNRFAEDVQNFGFLSLWRDDGTRCDIRTDFVVPAM